MKEALVDLDQPIMPNQQSTERSEPSKSSLHDPSMSVTTKLPAVLMACPFVGRPSRDDRLDSSPLKTRPKRVAVVSPVGDQAIRIATRCARPMGSTDRHILERRLDESHFRRGRRVQVCSQRSTRAIDQNHPLCALSSLGLADFEALFLAGAKLPSMKHSSHWIRSSSASSARKARHNSSRVPFSSHSFSRRQQVDALAYRSGSSLHGEPVQRTRKMPSKQRLSSALGRPPFGLGWTFGRCRETSAHCSAVRLLQAIDHLRVIRVWSYANTPNGVLK